MKIFKDGRKEGFTSVETWKARAEINGKRAFDLQEERDRNKLELEKLRSYLFAAQADTEIYREVLWKVELLMSGSPTIAPMTDSEVLQLVQKALEIPDPGRVLLAAIDAAEEFDDWLASLSDTLDLRLLVFKGQWKTVKSKLSAFRGE